MKITILGASGHGKVVADIAKLCGYDQIEFLDDDVHVQKCGLYPVVGQCKDAIKSNGDVFVAMGNYKYRKKYLELLSSKSIPVLIHPDAVISENTEIGRGTVVMAGTVVNPGSKIGRGCIINTCSSIDHDCTIGDYVHVAVGTHLCGAVEIGNCTWVGTGAIISNNVYICSDCIIGAGAVVIKDIVNPGTYIGVPARKMEKTL